MKNTLLETFKKIGGFRLNEAEMETGASNDSSDPKDVQKLIDRFSTNQQMKMAVKKINQPVEIVPSIMAFIQMIQKDSGAAGKMTKAHLAKIRNSLNDLEI
jgi:hypothetical protein